MDFTKISEQNAWNAVNEATQQVRQGESVHPSLLAWFRQHGVDPEQAVFPCIGLFDDGVFSGTLVTQDRRVIEYFVDMDEPEAGDFEDVTDELGPKDPSHPQRDILDLITMSLVFYDHHHQKAA